MRDSYDVYLVLNDFRACASEHLAALNPLSTTVESHLVGAEGYLDPDADTGLLVLRFKNSFLEAVGPDAIVAMLTECGLPMIIPTALQSSARRNFYMRHLRQYSVYLQQYAIDGEAYGLLTRTLMGLSAHTAEEAPREGFAITLDRPIESAESVFDSFQDVWGSTLDVAEQDILAELPVVIDMALRPRRADTVL